MNYVGHYMPIHALLFAPFPHKALHEAHPESLSKMVQVDLFVSLLAKTGASVSNAPIMIKMELAISIDDVITHIKTSSMDIA